MPPAHRQTDRRACGAATIVTGQSSVYVNGKLWAVQGDQCTHGAGQLIPTGSSVTVNGKRVIVHTPDQANPDNEDHSGSEDQTGQGSSNVTAYG